MIEEGKSGTRMIDARRLVRALAVAGTDRLVVELWVGPEGMLKASALVGALLGLAADAVCELRVHKTATRFRVVPPPAATASA